MISEWTLPLRSWGTNYNIVKIWRRKWNENEEGKEEEEEEEENNIKARR